MTTPWQTEAMAEEESQLIGAVILGRCAILRPPAGDQEGRELVRVASGLWVKLASGAIVGVWWVGPAPGRFVTTADVENPLTPLAHTQIRSQ